MNRNIQILFCCGLLRLSVIAYAADFYFAIAFQNDEASFDQPGSGLRYGSLLEMRYPIRVPIGIRSMRELLPKAKAIVAEMTLDIFSAWFDIYLRE